VIGWRVADAIIGRSTWAAMRRVCGVVGRLIERAFCAGLSVRRVIAFAGFRAGQNRRGDALPN
jgi:hypothetical protein